jgi:hypothetical protein
MPKLPGIRHRDAVRVFEKLGYRIARESGHIIKTLTRVRPVQHRRAATELFKMLQLPPFHTRMASSS